MLGTAVLLSIRPEYAKKIFSGDKTVELRRKCPRVKNGDLVLVYVSSPIKALIGAFRVDDVITKPPVELWEKVKNKAGITLNEFNSYYDGASVGHGIYFSEVWRLPAPLELEKIRELIPGFHPPQVYQYLSQNGVMHGLLTVALGGRKRGMSQPKHLRGLRLHSLQK